MRTRRVVCKARIVVDNQHLKLFAEIVSDPSRKFPQGHRILTSRIIAVEGNVVRTENNDYAIDGPTTEDLNALAPNNFEKLYLKGQDNG